MSEVISEILEVSTRDKRKLFTGVNRYMFSYCMSSNVLNHFLHAIFTKNAISHLRCNAVQFNVFQFNTVQYNSIQLNTIQYNTIHYNTIQFNTTQYNTIQYNAP